MIREGGVSNTFFEWGGTASVQSRNYVGTGREGMVVTAEASAEV